MPALLQNTKYLAWGPELDTTTSVKIFSRSCVVFNVAKAWRRALEGYPRGVIVRIYGGGKKTVCRRYRGFAKPPKGLRCQFSFQVVTRGNGYVALTRGPLVWSVCRSQPEGVNPRAPQYLVGGALQVATLTEANRLVAEIFRTLNTIVSIETLDR